MRSQGGRLWIGFLTVVLVLAMMPSAFAQESAPPESTRKLKLGADIGVFRWDADGTAMAIGLSGDYVVAPHVSIGPLMQIGVTENLSQLGVSVQAKLTLDLPDVPQLKPQLQAGLGFIHADLDFGPFSADDTSWLIPLGMGIEYRAAKQLSFDATRLFNVTDLHILNQSDHLQVTGFVGVRHLS